MPAFLGAPKVTSELLQSAYACDRRKCIIFFALVWKVKHLRCAHSPIFLLPCSKRFYLQSSNSPNRCYENLLQTFHLNILLPCHQALSIQIIFSLRWSVRVWRRKNLPKVLMFRLVRLHTCTETEDVWGTSIVAVNALVFRLNLATSVNILRTLGSCMNVIQQTYTHYVCG